jgi:hypothetical protein
MMVAIDPSFTFGRSCPVKTFALSTLVHIPEVRRPDGDAPVPSRLRLFSGSMPGAIGARFKERAYD